MELYVLYFRIFQRTGKIDINENKIGIGKIKILFRGSDFFDVGELRLFANGRAFFDKHFTFARADRLC